LKLCPQSRADGGSIEAVVKASRTGPRRDQKILQSVPWGLGRPGPQMFERNDASGVELDLPAGKNSRNLSREIIFQGMARSSGRLRQMFYLENSSCWTDEMPLGLSGSATLHFQGAAGFPCDQQRSRCASSGGVKPPFEKKVAKTESSLTGRKLSRRGARNSAG